MSFKHLQTSYFTCPWLLEGDVGVDGNHPYNRNWNPREFNYTNQDIHRDANYVGNIVPGFGGSAQHVKGLLLQDVGQ